MNSRTFNKKAYKENRLISTASLPDIVFMLLFFFMVTTVVKQEDLKIKVKTPVANQVKKLEKKSLITNLYIGKPVNRKKYGTITRIQLDDAFVETDEIKELVTSHRTVLTEPEQHKMIVSLKVDEETEMGIVTDIKQELRKAGTLKINYSTVKEIQ